MSENKFPTEIIDLPSEGKLYPKDSPLSSGKIEIKYMTAKEEDILTSQNLIKKGLAIDTLLNSLIVTKDVNLDDLILGDKNAVMVAARILAYGPEYVCEVTNPTSGTNISHTFNLAECPFIKLPEGITENKFEIELPVSKTKVTFKVLTGKEEKEIERDLNSSKKIGTQISPELTTRLKHMITSINGDPEGKTIREFVDQAFLARDARAFREFIQKIQPDVDLTFFPSTTTKSATLPIGINFFWPDVDFS